jgi:uncharacterized protein involved in outer membrane biogenesis
MFPGLILERVTVHDIDFILKKQTGKITRARLDKLTIKDVLNHKSLSFAAQGVIDNRPFSLTGQFGALTEIARTGKSYPLKLEISSRQLNLTVSGSIADFKKMKGLDVQISTYMADAAPLLKAFNLKIPINGALRGQGHLRGDLDLLQLSNLNLTLNRAKMINLQISGSVADLAAMKGINASVSGSLREPEILKWLLPVELYAISDLTFSADVASQGKGYLLKNINARGINSKGLQVNMSGQGLLDNFAAVQPFGDLDILIKVDSPDTASVQGYLLDGLPELGRAVGSVRLTAPSYEDLAVEDIDVILGRPDDLQVTAQGSIAKIPLADIPNTGIDLRLDIEAIRTERLAYLFSRPLPEIGPVSLKLRFYGSKIKSKISEIELAAGHREEIILNVQGDMILGNMNDDDYLQGVNLVVDFLSLPGRTNFAMLPLSEIKGRGHVTRAGEKGEFTGKVTIGKTELTTKISALFSGNRPIIEGNISADFFDPDDFIFHPAADKKPEDKSDSANIFSHEPLSFAQLDSLDLSLDLALEQVIGKASQLDKVEMKVRLEEGRLVIDPLSFIFKGGFFKGKAKVDSTVSPPKMSLTVKADDVDLGSVLSYLQQDLKLDGNLNLFADISSQGISPHDIAANLQGDVEMALEHGKIPRAAMELLTVDLFGWTLSKTIRQQKFAKINCGIVGIKAEKGVLTTNSIILDSERVFTTGKGSIDLGAETIDLVLLPKKKKKFWSTITPVHLKGPLADPRVRAIPAKSTGLATAGIFLAPQIFLPASGLNYLWEQISSDKDSKTESPCVQKILNGRLGNNLQKSDN